MNLRISTCYRSTPSQRKAQPAPTENTLNSGHELWVFRSRAPSTHSSFDGVLSYVLQGKCIGMVAGYIARDPELSERIRALNLPDFYMKRKVIAAHAIRPDPLVADFLQFLREFYLPSSDSQPGDLRKLADSKFS